MTRRRAISPPPGSVQVPRLDSHKVPADLIPTVAPPSLTCRQELETTRRALREHADSIRSMLAIVDGPDELARVLAAIDHLVERR
jgi:hypothetical protein